jgi:hypothetical protein
MTHLPVAPPGMNIDTVKANIGIDILLLAYSKSNQSKSKSYFPQPTPYIFHICFNKKDVKYRGVNNEKWRYIHVYK